MVIHMKKFIAKVGIFVLLIGGTVVPVNVLIDPYNIFHADRIRDNGVEPNKNYFKTKYIIENPDKFDSYLLGSSRVGFMDVEKMKGGSYYDMMYSEGLPYEHLKTLKAFISHGVIPKNVLMGVDDISYFVDPAWHEGQLYRLSFPYEGDFYDKLGFYIRYLDIITTLQSLKTIRKYGEPNLEKVERYYRTGTEDLTVERPFDENANVPYWADYYSPRLDQVMNEIREIRDLCQEYGISLTVFTNPIHATTYAKDVEHGYLDFLEALADIVPYYNFSGFNNITLNNDYYYETSHFKPLAGDVMIQAMFGQGVSEELQSQGFGVYVTKENKEEIMGILKEQVRIREIACLYWK